MTFEILKGKVDALNDALPLFDELVKEKKIQFLATNLPDMSSAYNSAFAEWREGAIRDFINKIQVVYMHFDHDAYENQMEETEETEGSKLKVPNDYVSIKKRQIIFGTMGSIWIDIDLIGMVEGNPVTKWTRVCFQEHPSEYDAWLVQFDPTCDGQYHFDTPLSVGYVDLMTTGRGLVDLNLIFKHEMEYCWCLLAIDGDCSNMGMSDTSECIVLLDKNKRQVWHDSIADFLDKQRRIDCFDASIPHLEMIREENIRTRHQLEVEKCALGQKLIELGIFEHKYHLRTKWMLVNYEVGHVFPFFDQVAWFKRVKQRHVCPASASEPAVSQAAVSQAAVSQAVLDQLAIFIVFVAIVTRFGDAFGAALTALSSPSTRGPREHQGDETHEE
jgi:hypothetical protein